MKKALEAGLTKREWFAGIVLNDCMKSIKSLRYSTMNYCDRERYSEDWRNGVANDALKMADAMLSALEEPEPEKPQLDEIANSPQIALCRKPEPQGSVVDWKAMEGCLILDWHFQEVCKIIGILRGSKNQWLKTKPAIDPEIKRVYEEFKEKYENRNACLSQSSMKLWQAIKSYVEKGGE